MKPNSSLIILACAAVFALVACGPSERTGPGMPPSDQLLGKETAPTTANPAEKPATTTDSATPSPAPDAPVSSDSSPTAPSPEPASPATKPSEPAATPTEPGPAPSAAPSAETPKQPEPSEPAATDSQTYDLRYSMKAGTTAKFRQDSSMQMSAPMMSKDGKPVEVSTTTEQSMKIVKATGNDFTVETTVTDSKVVGAGSKEGMGSAIAGQLAQAKGSKSTAVYTSLGKPSKPATDAASTQQMLNDFGRSLGFQGLVFPGKKVKVGESWSATVSLDRAMGALSKTMGGSAKMDPIPVNTTFSKVEMQGTKKIGVFNVVMRGKPKMSASGGKAGSLGMQLVINSQGELKIDLATGLLVSSIVTVENSFAFSGAGMGEANGMKMSQLIRINTRRL